MKKLKLAIISPYPPSKVTLNEYGYHLVKHFAQKEEIEEIVVLTNLLDDNTTYQTDVDHVRLLPCWTFNSLFSPIRILQTIRREKPDVVLLNLQFMSFGTSKIPAALGLMIPALLRLMGVPAISLLHNIMEEVDLGSAGFTKNKVVQWAYKLIGTMLTRLVLQSNLVGVTIEKYVQVLRDKYRTNNVVLIPHGTFEIAQMPVFNKPTEGPLKVMTFGKFGTYKKVEVLIEAVQKLRGKRNIPIEVVIAGTDSPNTPGYLDSVKEKYSHVKGVTYTGYVPEEDVEGIFTESTVVVFPYTSTTGSSGVLHQAGSYGKATILPRLGDLERLIETEGYCGSYFEPNDAMSLADSLEKVLTDRDYRKSLAYQNYQASISLSMSDITDWYLLHFGNMV